jgi:FAD dependent oxidoreductase
LIAASTSYRPLGFLCLITILCTPLLSLKAVEVVQADVIVYGASPAGIIAAYEAGLHGKSVVLIESSQHVGGMMTSGLTASDYHDPTTVGGKALEFFYRVNTLYQSMQTPSNKMAAKRAQVTSKIVFPQWNYESHVGEKVFNQMLLEAGVTCVLGQRIDRVGGRGISKLGNHIVSITMETGEVYQGSVFIDATYEGDLMSLAGVSYTIGRESNITYNETLNGFHPQPEFTGIVDPYVIEGDPTSGLLPGIESSITEKEGDADNRVQAYNFRLCMTNDPQNMVTAVKPIHYNPLDYELLSRLITKNPDSVFGQTIMKFAPLPNNKVDVNAADEFSTDLVGPYAKTWAEASYAQRDEITKHYINYIQGFLWFVTNDERVPQSIRDQASQWGLAADEFVDNNNLPYKLYIREARRMKGSYLMTQANVEGNVFVPDPIAVGTYGIDSHFVSMYLDSQGQLNLEGGTWEQGINYGISYRSITPVEDECDNLIVPVCASATHVAFDSMRMEPVYMEMGHAAGAAASLAIDNANSVQSVNYDNLANLLTDEGQVIVDPDWFADFTSR